MGCCFDQDLSEFMQYATVSGRSEVIEREGIEALLHDCAERVKAYILPNSPYTCAQKEAFKEVVFEQLLFELSPGNDQLREMPAGIKSFTVNGFSATMQDGASDGRACGVAGICSSARSKLLTAGLLYRGVATC